MKKYLISLFLVATIAKGQTIPEGLTPQERSNEAMLITGSAMYYVNQYYKAKDPKEKQDLRRRVRYYFDLATRLDSLHPNIYHYRSFAYRAYGHYDSALMDINAYEKIILSDTTGKKRPALDIASYRAYLLANLGQIRPAIAQLHVSLKNRPIDGVDTYFRLGWLWLLTGDTLSADTSWKATYRYDAAYFREKYLGQQAFVELQGDSGRVEFFYRSGESKKFFMDTQLKPEKEYLTFERRLFGKMYLSSAHEFLLRHPFFFWFKAQKFRLFQAIPVPGGPTQLLQAASPGWMATVSFVRDTTLVPIEKPADRAEEIFARRHFCRPFKKAQPIVRYVPFHDVGYYKISLIVDPKLYKKPAQRLKLAEKVFSGFRIEVPEEAYSY